MNTKTIFKRIICVIVSNATGSISFNRQGPLTQGCQESYILDAVLEFVYFLQHYSVFQKIQTTRQWYTLVRPFLYFDRSTSTSLLRPLYFDLLSNLEFLLVEKYGSKYSFGRNKVWPKKSK